MSKRQKRLQKLLQKDTVMIYDEIERILLDAGFTKMEGAGSRVKFRNGKHCIGFDKSHTQNTVKDYIKERVRQALENMGVI